MIKMIMAVDAKGGIGKNDKLPWHIPSEFKYFREYTNGCMCIMGRKTYEDVKSFKKTSSGPFLHNRKSLVISTDIRSLNAANTHDGITFCDNIEQLESMLNLSKKDENSPDVCIIGGKSIYEKFIRYPNLVDEISISFLENDYDCDTFIDIKEITKGFSPHKEIDLANENWKVTIFSRKENYEN